jgi:hypothetical protein
MFNLSRVMYHSAQVIPETDWFQELCIVISDYITFMADGWRDSFGLLLFRPDCMPCTLHFKLLKAHCLLLIY